MFRRLPAEQSQGSQTALAATAAAITVLFVGFAVTTGGVAGYPTLDSDVAETEINGTLAVVDDRNTTQGIAWANKLDSRLGNYSVTQIESEDVLGAGGSIDDYDAYFAHRLAKSNTGAWFNATARVPAVYTRGYLAKEPQTLSKRSRELGDPTAVFPEPSLQNWTVETDHPIFDGVADVGDAIRIFPRTYYGGAFNGTDGEVLASYNRFSDAMAVDDTRRDVLLSTLGTTTYRTVDDHTDDAIDVLANSLTYYLERKVTVEGQVTDTDGDPVANATVKAVDQRAQTTTDTDGNYSIDVPPTEVTLEVSAFGYETVSTTVNGSSGANIVRNVDLTDRVAVTVVDSQQPSVESGSAITASFDVRNADTVTVENRGSLTAGLNLSVNGTSATVGDPVSVTDGTVPVTVTTTENTSGTVDLVATFDGPGETVTLTTGSTDVFVDAQRIGVVADQRAAYGVEWAAELDAQLGLAYTAEQIGSKDVLGTNGSVDDYDAYFVHGLAERNEMAWFNATDSVPTVYTAQDFGPTTLDQRNRSLGDPTTVSLDTGLATWTVDTTHPIFDGIAGPGEEIQVHTDPLEDGASFEGTNATVLASAQDNNSAVAVDDAREDVLLTAVGASFFIEVADHTDDVVEVLANSLTYYLEGVSGTVADATGTPVAGASIDVVGEQTRATTDANGRYEVALDPGKHTVELSAGGHESVTMSMSITDDEMLERDIGLTPAHNIGDVEQTGELGIVDAVLIQRHLAELEPEPFDPTIADLERDSDVSIVDAVMLQQYLADLRTPGSTDIATVDAPATVTVGDSVSVSVTVTNSGGLGILQNVEHRLAAETGLSDGYTTVGVDTVDLGPGDRTELTATINTTGLAPGTYRYEVVTDDDTEQVSIEVDKSSS
jgi:hypothetical protein